MKKTLLLFGAVGGVGVPAAFTLAAWALRRLAPGDAGVLTLLHDVQLPLWPMSKMLLDDPAAKHWLYLPLAALLSNALIYAAVGAASLPCRRHRVASVALAAAVVGLLAIASRGFGSSLTGFVVAAALAIAGLAIHGRAPAPLA